MLLNRHSLSLLLPKVDSFAIPTCYWFIDIVFLSTISLRSSFITTFNRPVAIWMQQSHRRRHRADSRKLTKIARSRLVVVPAHHRRIPRVHRVRSESTGRANIRQVPQEGPHKLSVFRPLFNLAIYIRPNNRCIHITDIGVGYISTMLSLTTLFLRWCSQVRDFGLQHLCSMRNLQILSLAGLYRRPTLLSLLDINLFCAINRSFLSLCIPFSTYRLPVVNIQRTIQYNSITSFARIRANKLPGRISRAFRVFTRTFAALFDHRIRSHFAARGSSVSILFIRFGF